MTAILNQIWNLNGIGIALINHNQMTLVGQTEKPRVGDGVSNLKSRQFLKFSTCNLQTLLRPGRLINLQPGGKCST